MMGGHPMGASKHPGGHPAAGTGHPGGHPGSLGGRSYRPGAGSAAKAFEERTGIQAPRIIAWEITRSCNLACAHCRASAHCEPYPGELSLDECKQVIDDIASITDPILILTGGEPLMRADIWDIIDYAHEKGLHPVIGTNGTLIDDECARRIAEHGIPRVSVSLDFPTASGQDAFRGKAGAFDEALAGMRNLRAHGVSVQVNTTVTKLNSHLLDDMHELAKNEGAAAFHPFLLVPTGRGEDLVDVELSPEEYEEVLTWAYRCQKTSPLHFKPTDAPQYHRIVHQHATAEPETAEGAPRNSPDQAALSHQARSPHDGNAPRSPLPYGGHPSRSAGRHPSLESLSRGCLGGITFAFISHVGDVQPCGYFDLQLGNVREHPFSQIWETSPVFDDLRHYDRLRGKCGACEYKGVCGGCRARALAATGDYLAEEPYCAYVPQKIARQRVLDEIQSGFPLESDPYGLLAERLGIGREQVSRAISSLRADGSIRRICASIASKKLGYASTLCALAVPGPTEEVDRVAALVNAHPEVTHNYLRDAELNVWFTAIAPSSAHLEQLVRDVAAETGYEVMNLPVLSLYKIRVDFGRSGKRSARTETSPLTERETPQWSVTIGDTPRRTVADVPTAPFDASDPFDVALMRWAQADVVDERPFQRAAELIAAETGDATVTEQRVLERLRAWKADGTIRRFGAFVHHRKLGYAFNGMTVWQVPEGRIDEVGRAFAALPYVSHCYERPAFPAWPYNLYAMVHAKTQEELDAYVAEMRTLLGVEPRVLVSTKEYKKALPVFFGGPLAQ